MSGQDVTWWESFAPFVAILCFVLAALLVWTGAVVIRGVVKRVPVGCWFGHKWVRTWDDGGYGSYVRGWRCERCPAVPAPCRNCGGQHDPERVTICVVERRS